MKIGFIGTGKLGMPCAEAIAEKGHDVRGYDVINHQSKTVLMCSDISVSYTHLTLQTNYSV